MFFTADEGGAMLAVCPFFVVQESYLSNTYSVAGRISSQCRPSEDARESS